MFFRSRRRRREALQSICDASEKIANGDLGVRILPAADPDLARVAQAINAIAERLEIQLARLSAEKESLVGILEGMVEGVLVTDSNNVVLLMNSSFRRMANVGAEAREKTLLECVRNKDVHDVVSQVLQEGIPREKEVAFGDGQEKIMLIMHAVPLAAADTTRGVVSVFNDVTKLRRLENMRRDFVANVSHELKTPLTNICGYAETLLMGEGPDPPAMKKFVEKIERNAIALERLVNDILELSRIESGAMVLDKKTLLLRAACDEALEAYADRIADRGLSFVNAIPSAATVMADEAALYRMLSNLIDNAWKHTPAGGTIACSVEECDGGMAVIIKDTGEGIAEEHLPHLFERFFRVDAGRSREIGGTGLGLAIVKHLALLHEGEVSVKSRLGEGSAFTLFFPN